MTRWVLQKLEAEVADLFQALGYTVSARELLASGLLLTLDWGTTCQVAYCVAARRPASAADVDTCQAVLEARGAAMGYVVVRGPCRPEARERAQALGISLVDVRPLRRWLRQGGPRPAARRLRRTGRRGGP